MIETVTIPLLCCKVHGEDVNRCITPVLVDSPLTEEKLRELGRELYEFFYANAPAEFLYGLLDASRVTREGL